MERRIDVDFSRLEKSVVPKPDRTLWVVCIAGVLLIASAVVVAFVISGNMDLCKPILLLYSIVALILVALCIIVYKVESIHSAYAVEEAKADAALRRKLAEDALLREIKIREKEINNTINSSK